MNKEDQIQKTIDASIIDLFGCGDPPAGLGLLD